MADVMFFGCELLREFSKPLFGSSYERDSSSFTFELYRIGK